MNGTGLLSLVTDTDQEFHLVTRSKVTRVTPTSEGVNVEEDAVWTTFTLVENEPILQREGRGREGEREGEREEERVRE